jgi:hypothetical protein
MHQISFFFIPLGSCSLSEVYLVVVVVALEDVLEIFGVAGDIESHRYDGYQMMNLRLPELPRHSSR